MANTATTTPTQGTPGNHAHIPLDHATYALSKQIPDIAGRGCIVGTSYGELTIPPGRLAEKLAQFLTRELTKQVSKAGVK